MKKVYRNNISLTQQEISVLEKKINVNSLLRLAVILLAGVWLFQVFQWNNIGILLISVFAVVIVFAALVRRQSRLEAKLEGKKAFLLINQNEFNLISDSDINIYGNGEEFDDGKHPYVSDLDIFGAHSLFAKINRAATADGVNRLGQWLLEPATKTIVEERQEASAEFADKLDWSQNFQAKLLFNLKQKTNIRTFLINYFQDGGLRFGSVFMRIYVTLAPYILLLGVAVSIFLYPMWSYVGALCLVHLFWTLAMAGKVSFFSNRIDRIGATLISYSDALKMVENEAFCSPLNQALQSQLHTKDGVSISMAFKSLGTLIDKLDARNNLLVGAVLNMIFLWDFKQVLAIVGWKQQFESSIVESFETIAELEALLSLGTWKRNHPSCVQPVILEDVHTDRLVAIGLNHPLIPDDKSIANDYSAQDHRVALVTGSNMAGKSTFLRTLGINAVLAYAGAVVCAEHFALPIYKLVTYMRIKDNLNESTSTFKAEIDRMRFILEQVEKHKDSFFLIDEMLRGTNSVDKYLGSKAIIKKLIAMEGKGMVATHDLQLASLEEEYMGLLKNYHFDIQVREGEMLFDYKLKDGKCTVFNASMLLKGIGIDVDN